MRAEVDRIDLQRSFAFCFNLILIVGCTVTTLLLLPWFSALMVTGFATWGLVRTALRQARWIAFDVDGVELGLWFRTHRIRHPVTEFSGARFVGVTVRDLRTDTRYELSPFWRSRRVIGGREPRLRGRRPTAPRPRLIDPNYSTTALTRSSVVRMPLRLVLPRVQPNSFQ